MDENFVDWPGEEIDMATLAIPKANFFALLFENDELPYANLLGCAVTCHSPLKEAIIFEVEVERPQILKNDIRRFERLAVIFSELDDSYPEVISLRRDFPQVPHLNLMPVGHPASLCLYNQPWEDINLAWSPIKYLERIREWLSLTSKGQLHQEDQNLEPIIPDSCFNIILPNNFNTMIQDGEQELIVYPCIGANGIEESRVLIAQDKDKLSDNQKITHRVLSFLCPAQEHGIIQHMPLNLKELNEVTSALGLDVVKGVKEKLTDWSDTNFLDDRLIIIILFPKSRHRDGAVEEIERNLFLLTDTIKALGVKLGVWDFHNGQLSFLVPQDLTKTGKEATILALNPVDSIDKVKAARYSGLSSHGNLNIVAIGAGALGSQVIMNLARSGFGCWTIIDDDYLLPHNLTRHLLFGQYVGLPKADSVPFVINTLYESDPIASGINANILMPDAKKQSIDDAIAQSTIILDMSASVAVERHIAHRYNSSARRVSAFLNPTGTDLVILTEDIGRTVRIDCIEMQYYREVYKNKHLEHHLAVESNSIRYAQSCRDITSRIPQEFMSLHSAITAGVVKQLPQREEAFYSIWKINPKKLSTECFCEKVAATYQQQQGGWEVTIDGDVLERIRQLREERLPNETGGVLIGSIDTKNSNVYIVDALPAPQDSVEWPALFIRGCSGLKQAVDEISRITAQNLFYVGEWHSHPPKSETRPSSDDREVFRWIQEIMTAEGKPAVMLIAGDNGRVRIFIDQIPGSGPEPICLSA